MTFEEFKNLPDTSTPLNAENLNELLKKIKNNSDMLANVNLIRPYSVTGDDNLVEEDTVTINRNYPDATNENVIFNNLQLKAKHNYILTVFFDGKISGGSYKVLYLSFVKKGSLTIGSMKNNGTVTFKFTLDDDDTINNVILDISAGTNFENLKMKFMLYEGTEEKSEYVEHLSAFDTNDTSFSYDETFRISEWYNCGIAHDGYVYFTLPLPKNTSNVKSFSIIGGTLKLYNSDGQEAYSNSNIQNINQSVKKYVRNYYVTIGIKIDSSFTQTIKDKTPVGVQLNNFDIKFN